MAIKQYINLLIKRLWLIILLPIIAGSVMGYMAIHTYVPTFSASTTLLVQNKEYDVKLSITYNDIMMGEKLAREYKEIIKSRAVTSEVVRQLKLTNMGPSQLAGKINVNLIEDTRILEIRVTDGNAHRAKQLADTVRDVFIKKIMQIMKAGGEVVVIDVAEEPGAPAKPPVLKNIGFGILGGIFVAVGIIFVQEELNNTIKTVEDVEKHLELKVLGIIPKMDIK
jgi:capsular polysaccharide biosynthesis protein